MRLLFIRHGDPDYEHDCLTDKGIREAQLLAQRMKKETMDHIYVSPMGRAQQTASFTLHATGKPAATMEWLQEFTPRIHRPDLPDQLSIPWDWRATDWMEKESFYDQNAWKADPILLEGNAPEVYDQVIHSFDALLESHGYAYNGKWYEVRCESHDTLVFFCHFGIQCVILSHLLHLLVMALLHGCIAAPTAVTELYSQEPLQGIATFRMTRYGDISHLEAGNEKPSDSGRFVECFSDDGRHQEAR